jgi:hypothetical protein
VANDLFGDGIDPGHGKAAFAIGDTEPLRIATFRVLMAWHERGWQPGAEKWQSDTRKWRPMLIDAIRNEWEKLAGSDKSVFPWHDDFVMLGFVALRKLPVPEKRRMCAYVGEKVIDAWRGDKEEVAVGAPE